MLYEPPTTVEVTALTQFNNPPAIVEQLEATLTILPLPPPTLEWAPPATLSSPPTIDAHVL